MRGLQTARREPCCSRVAVLQHPCTGKAGLLVALAWHYLVVLSVLPWVGRCTSTAARPRCCVWSAQCGVAHARGSGVATGRRESAARGAARHIGFESEEERRRVAIVAVRSHSPRMRQERAEHLCARGNHRHARQTQRYGSGRLCGAAPARRFAYLCAVPLLRCDPQVGRQTAIGQRYRPAVYAPSPSTT